MKKFKAQSIIEFGITFIIAIFIVFFILECAFYYQAFNALQTFSDEANANFVLYDNVCSEAQNDDILSMLTSKARKYLKKDLELRYIETTDNFVKFESLEKIKGESMLTVKVSCAPSSSGVMTKSSYIYNGPFLFRFGNVLSSVSSVQTPKF